jgi:hypothetical protein
MDYNPIENGNNIRQNQILIIILMIMNNISNKNSGVLEKLP